MKEELNHCRQMQLDLVRGLVARQQQLEAQLMYENQQQENILAPTNSNDVESVQENVPVHNECSEQPMVVNELTKEE